MPEDKTEGTRDYSGLVGKTGVVTTVLRPAGKINIDGEIVDVVARDGFVEVGATVTVLSVEGSKVIVAEA